MVLTVPNGSGHSMEHTPLTGVDVRQRPGYRPCAANRPQTTVLST